jgi:hypothetical protein
MANPQISPGVINLLQTSITVQSFPSLNVTPSFLGKQMVRLALDGEITRHLPVAVGVVPSPQVYLMGMVTINLVKSQPLAQLYKAQWETNSFLGNIVVRPDTTVLQPFDLSQVAIADVRELSFNGEEPDLFVTLRGQYLINSALWP